MENETKLFDTLLGTVDNSDYQNLLFWEKLKSKGYKINYIVDADIIGNYCFPKGISPENRILRLKHRNLSDSYLHDEQVTLFILFYLNTPEHKLVILNEYIDELKLMINAAKYFLEDNSISNYFTDNIDEIITDGTQNLNALVKNHFSEMVVSVIEQMKGLDKFLNLLKNKTFIFDSEDFNNILLEGIFNECKGEASVIKKTHEYFRDFYPQNIMANIDKDIDSIAISRTIQLNSKLVQNNNKEIFLFIGDSKAVKYVFNELSKSIVKYPEINNEKIPLYCSIQQYFAYLICKETKTDKTLDYLKTIENLNDLRLASKNIDSLFADNIVDVILRNSKLFANYTRLRNQIENIRLFKNFDSIYSHLKDYFNEKRNSSVLKTIFETLKEKQNDIIQEYDNEYVKLLDNLKKEAELNASFLKIIEHIQSGKTNFTISKGKDVIEGSYQLLPILLNFDNANENYNSNLFLLIELVLNKTIEDSEIVCKKLEKLIISLGKITFKGNYPLEQKLIKALIFLLLPSIGGNDGKNYDSGIYDWIKEEEQHLQEHNNKVKSEFLYFSCWVARRCGDYEQSKNYAQKGIENYQNDPRFYHGLFLAQYCMYYNHKDIQLLNEILNNAEQAFYSYHLYFLKSYNVPEARSLIELRFLDCFNNNFCYFYAEMAWLKKDISYKEAIEALGISRKKLELLKKSETRKYLSEYYETESHLEFIESKFYEKFNSLDKLNHSLRAINIAIEKANSLELRKQYHSERLKIVKEIQKQNAAGDSLEN